MPRPPARKSEPPVDILEGYVSADTEIQLEGKEVNVSLVFAQDGKLWMSVDRDGDGAAFELSAQRE